MAEEPCKKKLKSTDTKEEDLKSDDEEKDSGDPFNIHFLRDTLSDNQKNVRNKDKVNWKVLGELEFSGKAPTLDENTLEHVKPVLVQNIPNAIRRCKGLINSTGKLSAFQEELLSLLSNYRDLFFTERAVGGQGEEARLVYCLHVLNHILKTRSKVTRHNDRMKQGKTATDEYRDQGFTRPKALILLPFRESALRVVNLLVTLLMGSSKGSNVTNKKRFKEEFSDDSEAPARKKMGKPDDFLSTFAGNIDDAFKFGISVTRKCLKLYADFYRSDIIIASPLGLRTFIGTGNADFLSSVEVLIVDQADVLMMQNWEHVLHVFEHLHQQPKDAHGADFSRIRYWALEGQYQHFRQTLLLSSVNVPLLWALGRKHTHNYAGRVNVVNKKAEGTLARVHIQVPQMFHRFFSSSAADCPDARFEHFVSKVLVHLKDVSLMKGTLIFVPSYFDFVRLRNHFKREDIPFNQICEYSKGGKVARARDMFFHGQRQFLLYTERAHFYHRYFIKGVRHVIFYELPVYPHFYSEVCNFLGGANKDKGAKKESVTVLWSQYDCLQLAAVAGYQRTMQMKESNRNTYMFVTG